MGVIENKHKNVSLYAKLQEKSNDSLGNTDIYDLHWGIYMYLTMIVFMRGGQWEHKKTWSH